MTSLEQVSWALGASAILVAAVQAGTLGAPISAMLLTIGLIAPVLLFIQERRATEPIVPFQLWRDKIMAIGNIGSLVVGALLMCVVAFLPTYMQGVMGRSATVAGAVIGAQSLSWSIGQHYVWSRHTRDILPNHWCNGGNCSYRGGFML